MKLQQPPGIVTCGKVLTPTAIVLDDEEVSRLLVGVHEDAPFAHANGAFCVPDVDTH